MPIFTYKARSASGQLIEGALEGSTASTVAEILRSQHITPIDIREMQSAEAGRSQPFSRAGAVRKAKISQIDLMLFSYQLHTLLRAGVPIIRALGGLQESAISVGMKEVIRSVREILEGGRELSGALARFPQLFSPFYLSMVRIGESTGLLEESFSRLFKHLEFERSMRDQVKSALRYPMFVVIAILVAIVVINVMVIPAFSKIFQSFGAELPLMTRVLLGFSNFTLAYWPYILAGLFAVFFVFRSWVEAENGRYIWHRKILSLPVAGKILHKAALARFARSFALSMRSGVPIMQAISNSAQTVDNAYMTRRIEGMRVAIERGESLLKAAFATGVFTPIVLQMIAVGEESGSLDDIMDEIGLMYQQEVEYELKTLGAQIEPILIVVLGVLVLILALGVFLPMWDLGRVALKR